MYVDEAIRYLYESQPIPETALPPVYVRKGLNKRMRVDANNALMRKMKTARTTNMRSAGSSGPAAVQGRTVHSSQPSPPSPSSLNSQIGNLPRSPKVSSYTCLLIRSPCLPPLGNFKSAVTVGDFMDVWGSITARTGSFPPEVREESSRAQDWLCVSILSPSRSPAIRLK